VHFEIKQNSNYYNWILYFISLIDLYYKDKFNYMVNTFGSMKLLVIFIKRFFLLKHGKFFIATASDAFWYENLGIWEFFILLWLYT